MKYHVEHLTRVTYSPAASMARFNLRLHPIDWPGQRLEDFALAISPEPTSIDERQGSYPSRLTRVVIEHPLERLDIRSRFTVEKDEAPVPAGAFRCTIRELSGLSIADRGIGAFSPAHYLYPSPLLERDPDIERWARAQLPPDAPALEAGLSLARLIQREFQYNAGTTRPDTPVSRIFATRRGVCQDFAHVMILALRAAGLAAAYVSGYLRTSPPPGRPRLIGVDAMHAWVALWCGAEQGWIGLDPTNGCLAETDHIVAAMGRDYSDVSPIDGIMVGGRSQKIATSVDVIQDGETAPSGIVSLAR